MFAAPKTGQFFARKTCLHCGPILFVLLEHERSCRRLTRQAPAAEPPRGTVATQQTAAPPPPPPLGCRPGLPLRLRVSLCAPLKGRCALGCRHAASAVEGRADLPRPGRRVRAARSRRPHHVATAVAHGSGGNRSRARRRPPPLVPLATATAPQRCGGGVAVGEARRCVSTNQWEEACV